MNDYSTESPAAVWTHHHQQWNFSPPNEVPQSVDREAQWKRFDSSVNAVSFGFVATAILISMFLVMAIFERFLRPRTSFVSANNGTGSRSLDFAEAQPQTLMDKLEQQSSGPSCHTIGVSVVMPGQNIPTFIGHPVPLPCPREGVSWPGHYHGNSLQSQDLFRKSIGIKLEGTISTRMT